MRGYVFCAVIAVAVVVLFSTNGYTQFFNACTTQAECQRLREVQRERFDRGESSVLFEAYRIQRGDTDRRQTEEIMRQWEQQRSRGGFPCVSREARCNE